MNHKPHSLHRLSPFLPVALFGLLLALSEFAVQIETKRLKDEERSQVLIKASTVRAQLESELNATLHITTGFTGYIAINPTLSGNDNMATMLATLFKYGRHLRNVGLAPDNIIRHVYPIKGNEQALGLNYEKNPSQWPAVQRAIESRGTVLAGPLNLVQGGRGLISRTPVFLNDGQYWGILSMVIDSDSLFKAAGLMAEDCEMTFALRGKDGFGNNGALFFGAVETFRQNPILLNLTVPGGVWQMAVLPENGWGGKRAYLNYFRIVGLIISLLLSAMVWITLADRRQIKYLALHDPLTGLPNRRLFDERLNYTIVQKQRQNKPFSLLYVDLDDFKPINDHYGHKAGDQVLREAARRMTDAVRHEDTVARIGGDEFMIILPSTGDKSGTMLVANDILQAIGKPYTFQGQQLDVNTSIGVSIYPESGNTEEALVRAADQAMYQAKNGGKRRICFDRDRC